MTSESIYFYRRSEEIYTLYIIIASSRENYKSSNCLRKKKDICE